MINNIINELSTNYPFFLNLLWQHIEITFLAVIIATLLGLAIGIYISQYRQLANPVISFVNIVYTIPSIAALGFLIPFTGIGNTTAIIALIIYALLPVVRSTYVGITTIDPKIIEASEAMGSTQIQVLTKIKLPLALPIIFAAIRNMVTMTIALAGIASFVGAGGLGVAIYRGITTNNNALIFIGSILIALLALTVDAVLNYLDKIITNPSSKLLNGKNLTIFAVLFLIAFTGYSLWQGRQQDEIKLASKPTTENYILTEIAGQLIAHDTNLKVHITHGVGGGTANIHPAMLKGDFDMYPDYTGTGWQIVLKHGNNYADKDFPILQKEYLSKYNLGWYGMFGFNDSYSLGIRKDLADKYQIKTFSDLAKHANQLSFGAEYDFFAREDGYNLLKNTYHMNFAKVVDMDNGLKYQALFAKQIDVITVFTTDGQISDPRIVVLLDDKNLYPKYMAGMVVRQEILEKHPELQKVLAKLDNLLDENTMSKLNYEVEVNKRSPKDVAKKFLESKGLLEDKHD